MASSIRPQLIDGGHRTKLPAKLQRRRNGRRFAIVIEMTDCSKPLAKGNLSTAGHDGSEIRQKSDAFHVSAVPVIAALRSNPTTGSYVKIC